MPTMIWPASRTVRAVLRSEPRVEKAERSTWVWQRSAISCASCSLEVRSSAVRWLTMASKSAMRSLAWPARVHFLERVSASCKTSTVSKGFLRMSKPSLWPNLRDLQVGAGLPDSGGGLDAVPAGGHADINEGHSIGSADGEGLLDHLQAFLALKGGVEFEAGVRAFFEALAKKLGAHFPISAFVGLGRENLPEILVDGPVVINDQNPPIEIFGHLILQGHGGASRGSTSIALANDPFGAPRCLAMIVTSFMQPVAVLRVYRRIV